MNRKRMGFAALVVLVLATGSLVALADPPYQDLAPKPRDPNPGCICPHNYDPVRCVASDGTVHVYSNACFAGCAGFISCPRYDPPRQ